MEVKVYCVRWCGPCNKLKDYLERNGVVYKEVLVGGTQEDREELLKISGQRAVPVMTYGDTVIVGYDRWKMDQVIKQIKESQGN